MFNETSERQRQKELVRGAPEECSRLDPPPARIHSECGEFLVTESYVYRHDPDAADRVYGHACVTIRRVESVGVCRSCQHWHEDEEMEEVVMAGRWGACSNAVDDFDVSSPRFLVNPDGAELITREDFGCVEFSDKGDG